MRTYNFDVFYSESKIGDLPAAIYAIGNSKEILKLDREFDPYPYVSEPYAYQTLAGISH